MNYGRFQIHNVSKNRLRTIEAKKPSAEKSWIRCYNLVLFEVAEPTAKKTWSLLASILSFPEIQAYTAEKYPDGDLEFKIWLKKAFILSPQSDAPLKEGIKTAILGSIYTTIIVILFSFPIGVAAAIYLEDMQPETGLTGSFKPYQQSRKGALVIYGCWDWPFLCAN